MKENGGAAMSGPFIFIATNRLKPGKLEDERKRVPGLCDFIEANDPRLIAFNEYASEDGTEVGVVQIHPDAESMAFHMSAVAERAAQAYAETLDATTSIQVYGGAQRGCPEDVESSGRGWRPARGQATPPRRLHPLGDKLERKVPTQSHGSAWGLLSRR
jgi:hypothetical protein